MEGEHVGPFNLGNPGEFTMLELAEVCLPFSKIFLQQAPNLDMPGVFLFLFFVFGFL